MARSAFAGIQRVAHKPVAFPNPVSGRLFVDLGNSDDEVNMEIHDGFGRLVMDAHSQRGKCALDTSELESGVYYLVLTRMNILIATQKFIKVK